jgi:hypothetical protein
MAASQRQPSADSAAIPDSNNTGKRGGKGGGIPMTGPIRCAYASGPHAWIAGGKGSESWVTLWSTRSLVDLDKWVRSRSFLGLGMRSACVCEFQLRNGLVGGSSRSSPLQFRIRDTLGDDSGPFIAILALLLQSLSPTILLRPCYYAHACMLAGGSAASLDRAVP